MVKINIFPRQTPDLILIAGNTKPINDPNWFTSPRGPAWKKYLKRLGSVKESEGRAQDKSWVPLTERNLTEFYNEDYNDEHEAFSKTEQSEAIEGALPRGTNSPQKPPYGLYAEKLSGTAFTAPRWENQQSWLYRILPSSAHGPFELSPSALHPDPLEKLHRIPNQTRWDPFDLDETVDWIQSLHLVAGAGDPTLKTGVGIYIFAAGRDMDPHQAFYSADGDFLIVLQHGVLDIQTEFGKLLIRPQEICIIPRGIKYRVTLPYGPVRGYILELYQNHFHLPELGPIGSNGLANARDFQIPNAHYTFDTTTTWTITCKFANRLFTCTQDHTPFDVVAWHGLYTPCKYNLTLFNALGSISYDHPDPSIFTVLTAPSNHPGTAVADFVIFPPRWLVAENTFRPPWYHRNTMSEFMGLICGQYDAKAAGKGGFQPAGASLHNVMAAHGPDAATYERARSEELVPRKVGEGSLAFMFECESMLGVTEWGLKSCRKVQEGYSKESWGGLKVWFEDPRKVGDGLEGKLADGTVNGGGEKGDASEVKEG